MRNQDGADGRAEQILLGAVVLVLVLHGSATIAYHTCVLLEVPARMIVIPCLPLLAIFATAVLPQYKVALGKGRTEWAFLLAVTTLGVVVGSFTLVVSRPDADDVQYFHRALLQLTQLDRPFIVTDELFDVPGLPRSAQGTVPSYELLVAMLSRLANVDALLAYHNLAPFLSSLLWVTVYVLLYRHFGLDRWSAVLATGGAFLFLLVDGNLHRSFGNVSIVRLWQGKALMWSVHVPATLLFVLRYLGRQTAPRLVMVFLVTVSAAGLSGSGLFLAPGLVVALALVNLFVNGVRATELRRSGGLLVGCVYSSVVLGLMSIGILENYDLPGFYANWPHTWLRNAGLVIDGVLELIRDLLILVGLPLVCLPRTQSRVLVALTTVVAGLYLNPWLGPWFLRWLTGGGYWRLVYLLPLPLCSGLVVVCTTKGVAAGYRRWRRLAVVLAVVAAVAAAYRHSVLTPPREGAPVWLKRPLAPRLPREGGAFCRTVAGRLDGRHVLAPPDVVHALTLLKPDVSVEAGRRGQTLRRFAMIGRPREGSRRVAAQDFVTDCARETLWIEAFRRSLENGVDAVIMRDCGEQALRAVSELLSTSGRWIEVERNHGYRLMLRDTGTEVSRHGVTISRPGVRNRS